MTVGRSVTKQQLDNAVANMSAALLGVFAQSEQISGWLASVTDTDLEGGGFGYTADDVYLLRTITEKIAAFRAQAAGGPPPTEAYNLAEQLVKVTGVGG